MDEIILHKADSLARYLKRIREKFEGHESELSKNFDMQDIIILNLQRACQTAIDMGIHIIRQKRLGIPKESREVFSLLATAQIIPQDLSTHLQKMVGFRNIAVHEYNDLDYVIISSIIQKHLHEFDEFARLLLTLT